MSGALNPTSSRRLTARIGVLLMVFAAISSCGGASLTLEEWEVMWREAVARVDTVVSEPITEAVCEETLGYLREVRPDLDPPPLADLEPPLDSWFAEAEDAFFECRFDVGAERVFQALNTFEAEVDTVLALEG